MPIGKWCGRRRYVAQVKMRRVVTRNSCKNGPHRSSTSQMTTTTLDRLTTRGTNKRKMKDDGGQGEQAVRVLRVNGKVQERRAPKKVVVRATLEPQVRMRRVASLNAMAKVHILYENEARSSPNTSASGSSGGEETPVTVALGTQHHQQLQQQRRKKKSTGEGLQTEVISAVTPKRMASLNAVAILAASYCPDWARAHRPPLASPSMTKGKKGSKEGKDEMPGKEKAKEKERGLSVAVTRCKKPRRRKETTVAQHEDSRPLSKVTRAATRDAVKFDDNLTEDRGHHHHHHHHHHLGYAWTTDHEPVKTEAVKMVSEDDHRGQGEMRAGAEVTITGMYINPTNNTSQSFCISRVHRGGRKHRDTQEGDAVNSTARSPTPVGQISPQHLMHAGNVIFHHPAPAPETCVNLGVGVPIVNVPLPRHFRSAFSVPHFGRHGALSYTHGYFQPAGPLIQTLPETCLIHKPIPFHPHGCSGDPSGNGAQSTATYFSPPPTPVHPHGRCKRKHEDTTVFSVPVTCPVKVEPPRPPDSPPPSSAGSLSPSQSPSISPPSSLYVRAGVGSGRALRVAVKVEDVLQQGYGGFSRVPSMGHRNRVFLHRHRGPRLYSNLSLSSSVSSCASSTSSNNSTSYLTIGDARVPAGHFGASPASKRPFPPPSSPSSTCSSSSLSKQQRIHPRHSNGWTWDGEPFQSQVTLHNDDPPVLRTCYPAMRHVQGDVIRSRDCVLLKSGPRKNDLPFVAKVTELWEDPEDGEMMASLLWYYRPEHTEQGRRPNHMEDEIFASKHYDVNSVACIEDKCYVLTFNEYCRYRGNSKLLAEGMNRRRSVVPELDEPYNRSQRQPPPRIPEDMVFFCRRVYDFRQKRLLKNPS